jgi:23S rRNA (uracil1939-C5)-methyltransferase
MAKPLCDYFGICNGCDLQDIDYEEQVNRKKNIVENLLKIKNADVFFDKPYFYRNRMEFLVGNNKIGLRNKKFGIVDTDKCCIASEKINKLLHELRAYFRNIDFFDKDKKTGTFIEIIIRDSMNGSSVVFVLYSESKKIGQALEMINDFAEKSDVNNIVVGYSKEYDSFISESFVVKGDKFLCDEILGKKFFYHAAGFFQNNKVVAEKMNLYCREILEKYDTKNATLVDLYGGVGTFGILNSDRFKDVIIVESFDESVEAAKKNIIENKTKNVSALCLDAAKIKKIKLNNNLYVIADPPRSGMDIKTIESLRFLKPKVIVYVSCNLNQLSKDILKFKEYSVKNAALFDMFPQTKHIEVVAELVLTT